MRKIMLMLALCALTVVLVSCKGARQQGTTTTPGTPGTATTPGAMGTQDTSRTGMTGRGATAMPIVVTSTAFTDSTVIPKQFTCEGKDVSPPLAWSGTPTATKSQVLIMDDPDAPNGTWTHWIVWNIPPRVNSLDSGVAKTATVAGMKQGQNSFPRVGYGGPCPPPGKAHRYYFTIYALDVADLGLPENANRTQLETAMQGHILAQGHLLGMYAKGGGPAAGAGATRKG